MSILKIFKRERTEERIKRTKQQEIEHLRKVRLEHLEDAAYWYCQGNFKEYARSAAQVLDTNAKLISRRRKIA